MEKHKSIVTWRDVIKLGVGITIGLSLTFAVIMGMVQCETEGKNNANNRNGVWQSRIESFSTEAEKLVLKGGIVADDFEKTSHPSIGIFKLNEKYGYYNHKTKEIVIPAEYDNAWEVSEDLAGVLKNGKIGFINLRGETVIGFNYAYHKSRLYDFVFRYGYCAVPDSAGLCGVIDQSGKWVIAPRYEFAVVTPEYVVLNQVRDFKLQMDYQGNVINDKVIDETEELYYPITEGSEEQKTATGYYKYRVNGYAGLMNASGEFLTKPIYNNVTAVNKNMFEATLEDELSVVLIDGSGKIL